MSEQDHEFSHVCECNRCLKLQVEGLIRQRNDLIDKNMEVYAELIRMEERVREEPKPRRMQGCKSEPSGTYHYEEHDENGNCRLEPPCRPVEPTPAAGAAPCTTIDLNTGVEHPRRMQANPGHSPGTYHGREHNENENCLPDGCRPVSPTPAAPDPGEGWRLLGHGETVLDGDEYLTDTKMWIEAQKHSFGSTLHSWHCPHRRRIGKPAEPEWEDVHIEHDDSGLWFAKNIIIREQYQQAVKTGHALAVSEPGFMGYVYANGQVSPLPAISDLTGGTLYFPVAWRRRKSN